MRYYTFSGATVTLIQKARKDNSAVKKGESYYSVIPYKYAKRVCYAVDSLPVKYKKNPIIDFIGTEYLNLSREQMKEALIYLAHRI